MNSKIHFRKKIPKKTFSVSRSTSNLFKNANYDFYTTLIKKNMENYAVDKDSDINDFEMTKSILNNTGIKIKKEEKEFLKKFKHHNNRSELTPKANLKKNNYLSNSLYVSIFKDTFYVNPFHSLCALKINNNIHSNIIKANINRQKNSYNCSIKENIQNKLDHLIKMPKIKISTISPLANQDFFFDSSKNVNNRSLNKNKIRKKIL